MNIQERIQLEFDIQSYWHASTGRGAGSQLDAIVHKDEQGIPCLPGRTVKGLLRDASLSAEHWGHIAKGGTDWLFGCSAGTTDGPSRFETIAGHIIVSDACLPSELIAWLAEDTQRIHRQYLFEQLYSTAVDYTSGNAKAKSLRGIEVTIPMKLYSTILIRNESSSGKYQAKSLLGTCVPLIRAIGAHRNRGLGRVRCTLTKQGERTT